MSLIQYIKDATPMTGAQLFPPQQDVVDHGMLDLGFSVILSLCTGAGKTTLAEMGIDRALARGERAIYLTPLKALAEEKIEAWKGRWPGRKIGIFTGDYDNATLPVAYSDAEILICTYERLDGILRHWQRHLQWLAKVGLVVVDEFHLLMDASRGPRLEGSISRLMRVNPFARVMGLSATASNHAELAAWLGGVSYHSSWRPVPLKHEVRRFKKLADKPGMVVDIVAETAGEGGQTLVFVSSRRRAEQLAAEVAAAGHPAGHHHAGLGLALRRTIEADFRAGRLACLIATPTLEMGLNLPCRTVVIADNTRFTGESFEPLPVWNYLQRAGRAGRPGQDGAGRAILLAPSWGKGKLPDYGKAQPEPIRSHLGKPANLAEQLLIEVASRACRTRDQLSQAFLPTTLAYRQQPMLREVFARCLDDLLSSGLMTEDEKGILNPTPVGWVAVRHQLAPATAKHLLALRDLDQQRTMTGFDLLLHHCWDAGLQPQLPAQIEVIEALEDMVCEIPSHLLDAPAPAEIAPYRCAGGVLMATLAWQTVQGADLEGVCERLDVYPYDAEVLREGLVRLLQASADLHAAADPVDDPEQARMRELLCGPSLTSRLRRLALQLEHGLAGEAVLLTLIPGCGGTLARRLLDVGINDLEDLANESPEDLAAIQGIGPKRAGAWIEAAGELVKEVEPDFRPLPACQPRTLAATADWPTDIDPGRLQRATTLKVDRGPLAWAVSGGAEEHAVHGNACDCADFTQHEPGWWCKHRLAVRLHEKAPELLALAGRLTDLQRPAGLAGHLADLALGRRWK